MPRQSRRPQPRTTPGPASSPPTAEEQVWLRADYSCHVFHYRMPETVAIASVNPVVPSPLTVKMALIAALLRNGQIDAAEGLAPHLPNIEVRIAPPDSALIFRALMRYVRPPRPPANRQSTARDPNTGGKYGTNPHSREFAVWGGQGQDAHAGILRVFLRLPASQAEVVEGALWQIGYLGAKDSLVTCLQVQREKPREEECVAHRDEASPAFGNFVVRLADFAPKTALELRQLIPSQRAPSKRDRCHYIPNASEEGLYLLPGEVASYGRVKLYQKEPRPS
ncbi:MAG: hypothetical protein ACUVX1_07265 [Chloroflexota bacterium]